MIISTGTSGVDDAILKSHLVFVIQAVTKRSGCNKSSTYL